MEPLERASTREETVIVYRDIKKRAAPYAPLFFVLIWPGGGGETEKKRFWEKGDAAAEKRQEGPWGKG